MRPGIGPRLIMVVQPTTGVTFLTGEQNTLRRLEARAKPVVVRVVIFLEVLTVAVIVFGALSLTAVIPQLHAILRGLKG